MNVYRKPRFLIISLSICTFLAGCATDPATLQMAINANAQAKPTIEMTCPAGGCTLAYTDPRDRQQVKLPTNGFDVMNNVVSTAGGMFNAAIVPAAFAYTAVKGFDAMKGSGQTTTTTTTTTNTDDHSATATPTVVQAPAPVVVQQPAPVQIPAPVVVQIPAGQVVAPVIVNPVVIGP